MTALVATGGQLVGATASVPAAAAATRSGIAPAFGGAALSTRADLPSGSGYWLVGSDGGVFAFGGAQFYGSLPGIGVHVRNIVGIISTPTGLGYWLVGSDGGVFSFGDASFVGSMGNQALAAPIAGAAGAPVSGPQGAVGPQGAPGATGAHGAPGSQGSTGITGAQGSQGATGTTGSQGAQGGTGPQGSQGSTGTQGSQGAVGAPGAQGAQGAVGPQGMAGPQGAMGAQGATGAQGAQGPVGPQGMAGSQGSQGSSGTQGSQGAAGSQGSPGSQGAQGATGPQAPAGSQGAQGAAGAQGSQGAQGANGTSGTFESSGVVSLTTIIGGGSGNVGLLPLEGAVASAPTAAATGGTISTDPTNNWVGQVVPANETLTGVSASFNVNVATSPLGFIGLQARIYVSVDGGLVYFPILALPLRALIGPVPVGSITGGSASGLDLAIPQGDLVMVVFAANTDSAAPVTALVGSATVGVSYTSG